MNLRNSAIAIVLAAACAHQPPREETRRYSVMMASNVAGSQVVTTRGNETTIDFEFNDRGRGPKLHTVVRTDARGVPVSIATSGNDYMKSPVEETFSVDGARVSWKNSSESGEGKAGPYYSSMYAPPEESAILARALLSAGGRMALHPAGEASIRKVGEATVRGSRHVTAYEISGLGFTPYEVWLDDDRRLFGTVSSWSSVVAEGYEADVKQLLALQNQRNSSRATEIARRLTKTPVRIVVVNARVFDPRTGKLSEPTTVITAGNRIASVGVENPYSAAELIDAKGGVLLPGLWDMHVHADDTDGLLHIAAGITSARDLGNDSDALIALKEKWDAGTAIGPRLVLTGLVDGPGPFQAPTNMLVATEDEGRQAIDFLASRKYEGLKIYSSIKPELVPFLTRYAHSKGMRVSGHVPAGMTAEKAVDAGYDEIQHVNMLFLNFMPDVTDTRTPARFIEPGKRGASLDLKSPEVRAFIEKLRSRKVVVDPTVSVFEGTYTARKGEIEPGYLEIAERLPPQARRYLLNGGLPVPDAETDRVYRASYARMLELVAELYRSGVTVVAGTDGLAGFTLHRELENYVRAGISPTDALKIATLVPAQVLKRDEDLGTIEPGKLADFIIVDGDPTRNISDIRKVVVVVKDGRVFEPKAIYAELGVK
ncbi:MAG TPA: amidohydrolase family protein [Thermoanaerobaculia bacterium]|nr:amidohydrolase family protein [Thermoanaerobaculia bacterium]